MYAGKRLFSLRIYFKTVPESVQKQMPFIFSSVSFSSALFLTSFGNDEIVVW